MKIYNMELKDIINSINSAIQNLRNESNISRKDKLVVIKSSKKLSFNAYSEYNYSLWAHSLIDKAEKQLLTFSTTKRTIESNKETANKEADLEFITYVIQWINSDEFKKFL